MRRAACRRAARLADSCPVLRADGAQGAYRAEES